MKSNMKALSLLDQRYAVQEDAFAEIRIWQVPQPVRGSMHNYKYSMAYVVGGRCVFRFDNEAGKGDHKHVGLAETAYLFTSIGKLLADFWLEVDQWQTKRTP